MPPAPAPPNLPPTIPSALYHSLLTSLTAPPNSLPVSPPFLISLLTSLPSSRLTAHPASLLASIRARILSTDITLCLTPSPPHVLPENVHTAQHVTITRIVLQVADVEDLAVSTVEALDALDMEARGERAGGRRHEVIRIAPDSEDNGGMDMGAGDSKAGGKGRHKLLLEDAAGTRVWGFEMERVEGVKVGMGVGGKLWVEREECRRGVVMMTRGGCKVMGGRVEGAEKAWREGRRERLVNRLEGKSG